MGNLNLSKNSLIVSSILTSGLLGFGIQKILVNHLSIEEYARYDLLLSFVFIFNGMLTVNFINYYKNRVSTRTVKKHASIPPFQFIVFTINSVILGSSLIVLTFFYKINILVSLTLLVFHLLTAAYEFKKVELNLTGAYKTYSWYILLQSIAYILLLVTFLFILKFEIDENIAIIIFCTANLLPLVKIKPSVYRLTLKRIKTFLLVGGKFMLPLLVYAILSWLNDNIGKYYLAVNGLSYIIIGSYIGVSSIVLKIIFTLSAGFDFIVTEKLFQKKIDFSGIKRLFIVFFSFGIISTLTLFLFSETLIKLFLNKDYLDAVHLVLPLGISALLIKYIHLTESIFLRFGYTKFNLIGYAILISCYVTSIILVTEKSPELMCYSQLISCLISASFMSLCLFFVVKKEV
jgi:O-antigen/teichoic acid export membrane protein